MTLLDSKDSADAHDSPPCLARRRHGVGATAGRAQPAYGAVGADRGARGSTDGQAVGSNCNENRLELLGRNDRHAQSDRHGDAIGRPAINGDQVLTMAQLERP